MTDVCGGRHQAGDAELIKAHITVLPDGSGLPPGRGNAKQGGPIYRAECSACQGDNGQGIGDSPALVSGRGAIASKELLLTVGSYWATATTVLGYIRRAMPYHAAGEPSDNDVYAFTAWVLAKN